MQAHHPEPLTANEVMQALGQFTEGLANDYPSLPDDDPATAAVIHDVSASGLVQVGADSVEGAGGVLEGEGEEPQPSAVDDSEQPPAKRARKGKAPAARRSNNNRGGRASASASHPAAGSSSSHHHPSLDPSEPSSSSRPRTVMKNGVRVSAPYTPGPNSHLTNKQQLAALREAYTRNPTPNKADLLELAKVTGRPWEKIREYFRQRRNKLRGVEELDDLVEPERAVSWLQLTYRSASGPEAFVHQLEVYQNYKTRFDTFHKATPLLGGQDLISLACATFPACTLARDEGDYLLKGIGKRPPKVEAAEDDEGSKNEGDEEAALEVSNEVDDDRSAAATMEDLVANMPEPLRAGTWLLHEFQDGAGSSGQPGGSETVDQDGITQSDLYAQYASRFGDVVQHPASHDGQDGGEQQVYGEEAMDHQNLMHADVDPTLAAHSEDVDMEGEMSQQAQEVFEFKAAKPSRMLTPVELIQLTKMTFKNAEAMVDESGRFIITGIEKREGVSKWKGKDVVGNNMFPFGLLDVPTSSPNHPFTSVLKRKLDVLEATEAPPPPLKQPSVEVEEVQQIPEPEPPRLQGADEHAVYDMLLAASNSRAAEEGVHYAEDLPEADKELVEGLRRFKQSRLGREVREACVSQ